MQGKKVGEAGDSDPPVSSYKLLNYNFFLAKSINLLPTLWSEPQHVDFWVLLSTNYATEECKLPRFLLYKYYNKLLHVYIKP